MRSFLREWRGSRIDWWTGWWGNKPPAHRSLLRLGCVSSAGLITIGVILDTNLFGQKTAIPSLSPFIWDLAKGTTLGTITLAILDDVRSWGVRWSTLQAESGSVVEAAKGLISTFLEYIGLEPRTLVLGTSLEAAAEDADRVTEWAHALESEFYEFLGAEEGSPLKRTPFKDWETFSSILKKANQPIPWLQGVSGEFDQEKAIKELSGAAEKLSYSLERIRPATSTGVSSQIGGLLEKLRILPVDAASLAETVHELRTGKTPWDPDSPQSRYRGKEIGTIYHTMWSLKSALELLAYERSTGRPHPFRPS